MSAFLWDHKLTYVSAPKVACTSLKHLFFEIENGRAWKTFIANGKPHYIHRFYSAMAFEDLPHARIADHERLCAVRDPVARLLSCYANRVIHHRDLHRRPFNDEMHAAGLSRDPTLEDFVAKLGLYRQHFPAVGHHSRPLVEFLGRDPSWYHGVYPLHALEDLRAHVRRVVGHAPALGHRQTGGPKLKADDLGASARRFVEDYYAEDYEIWGQWL